MTTPVTIKSGGLSGPYIPARKRRTFLRDLGIADLTDAVLIGGSIFFIVAALYVWVPFLAGRVS